jgi:predicted nucleic acid-binding protein
VARGEIQAVTSPEVLQEILHRYHRLDRPDVAQRVYELVVQLCAEVFPVTIADTDACVSFLRETDGSVRHALHVAVMRNHDVDTVASYDTAFGLFGLRGSPWSGSSRRRFT